MTTTAAPTTAPETTAPETTAPETTAGPAPLPTDPTALAARVVVGMDDDPASVAALRFAATEAAYRGGDVVALHVFHYPSIWGVFPVWPEEGQPAAFIGAGLQETVDGVLAERVAAGEPAVEITPLVVEGINADELRRAAAGVALLVLGARHHSRVLGSVSSTVLNHSAHGLSCPVVVVPAAAVVAA
jgi:nucleotide-binding universal stress UspA family protein